MFWIGFIIVSVLILSGCGDKDPQGNLGSGLTRQVYEELPVYAGRINSVGTLTQGYIQNTESLLTANSRLNTLCLAHRVCTNNPK